MIIGGTGGANTRTGLTFESRVGFIESLTSLPGYTCHSDGNILFNGKPVALNLRKGNLYKYLKICGVDYSKILSKKLLPDDAIYVLATNTLFVIEMKFQCTAGSVDEKPQTCHFKKRQYERLVNSLGIKVEYIYLFSEWFKKPEYVDMLAYIKDVGCDYYFDTLSLSRLQLPI